MALAGNQVSKVSVSSHFDNMLTGRHETLNRSKGATKSLRHSINHGHEVGVLFLYVTGAIESKIIVQELFKSLTN